MFGLLEILPFVVFAIALKETLTEYFRAAPNYESITPEPESPIADD